MGCLVRFVIFLILFFGVQGKSFSAEKKKLGFVPVSFAEEGCFYLAGKVSSFSPKTRQLELMVWEKTRSQHIAKIELDEEDSGYAVLEPGDVVELKVRTKGTGALQDVKLLAYAKDIKIIFSNLIDSRFLYDGIGKPDAKNRCPGELDKKKKKTKAKPAKKVKKLQQ